MGAKSPAVLSYILYQIPNTANQINLARLVTSDQARTPLSESWQDRINGKKSQSLTGTYIRRKKVVSRLGS
jgi:hypothetical protein